VLKRTQIRIVEAVGIIASGNPVQQGNDMKKNGMKGVDVQEYYCPHCGMYINLMKAIDRVAKLSRSGKIECPYCKKTIATLS